MFMTRGAIKVACFFAGGWLTVAAGCSSDDGEPGFSPGKGDASAGKGGAPDAGGGTSGGGGAGGGKGGADAAPEASPPTVGQECLSCQPTSQNGTVCNAIDNCSASPLCSAWMTCIKTCNTDTCAVDCDAKHPDVAPHYYKVYECLCTGCQTRCGALSVCGHKCVDDVALPPMMTPPATLAETGLYKAPVGATSGELAAYAKPFEPEYVLWSDGATKKRYVYIPKCSQIDTSDMDHWNFPVGTRFWKEFTVASANSAGTNVRVETRLIHRFGPGENDWIFGAYQWDPTIDPANGNPATAKFVPNGVPNANGTQHDIPAVPQCTNCHGKLKERILSFSAIQLSHALPGETIKNLSERGWLTVGAAAGFDPPGDDVAKRALGYLHANCGNCHNDAFKPVEPAPLMRLLVAQKTVESTDTFTSLVNVRAIATDFAAYDRIEPGDPDLSEIVIRMQRRPPATGQMPPIATKIVHTEGVASVATWIRTLSTTVRDSGARD
jgi:hypothetical protein